jgi:hypothetical protein
MSARTSAYLAPMAAAARANIPVTLNINLMYQTSFACLFFMALFSLKSLADFVSQKMIVRNSVLDAIALRVFDVTILQAVSVLIVAFVILRALRLQGAEWASKRQSVLYIAIFIGIILCIEFTLEKVVFKPTFSFNRPAEHIGEPWFTEFLRYYYDYDLRKGSSTPSGFVVRQTMLALLFVLAIHQPQFLQARKVTMLSILHFANISLLLFMAWLRLYTGAHRLYDVAIAIGIGGFLFWTLIFIFLSFRNEIRSHIGDFALPALTFAFMILLYSQHFARWVLFCLVVITTLATLFHPISSAPSCRKT